MNRNYLYVTIFLVILVVVGGIAVFATKGPSKKQTLATASPAATIGTTEPVATSSAQTVTMENGLQIQDEVVGTGVEAVAGKSVTVNYIGTLTDGIKFDSSYDRNQPFTFNLGAGEVIQGWDQGVVGMKVGGKRKLTIPPSLGYGSQTVGSIPPNSTLIFEVELLNVE